jgi:hypothetical protein
MYLRICGGFTKSANRKKFGQLIANPQRVTFAEGLQTAQISLSPQICDLRNFFADRPALSKVSAIFLRRFAGLV